MFANADNIVTDRLKVKFLKCVHFYLTLLKQRLCNQALILFDLILYVPSTIFLLCRDESSCVEPVLS